MRWLSQIFGIYFMRGCQSLCRGRPGSPMGPPGFWLYGVSHATSTHAVTPYRPTWVNDLWWRPRTYVLMYGIQPDKNQSAWHSILASHLYRDKSAFPCSHNGWSSIYVSLATSIRLPYIAYVHALVTRY